MDDLVSIIVPVYNVDVFLSDCIDSLISQSYLNIQIILIDDGSTDNSPYICDEYALRDKRIEVIHKQNGGLSDARNVGIKMAKGIYITFVDSDDTLQTDAIEYLYNLVVANSADMAVCQKIDIDEYGKIRNVVKKTRLSQYTIRGNENCMHDFLTKSNIGVTAWGKLYSLSLFENISFPMGRYHEDLFTTYKIIGLCNSIVVGMEAKYCYRRRSGSIMQQSFSFRHLDAIDARIEQSEYIKLYYPSEIQNAYFFLIYSVNQCLYKMGISNYYDFNLIKYMQMFYRKYILYFIKNKRCSFLSKCFTISAYLSTLTVFKILSI